MGERLSGSQQERAAQRGRQRTTVRTAGPRSPAAQHSRHRQGTGLEHRPGAGGCWGPWWGGAAIPQHQRRPCAVTPPWCCRTSPAANGMKARGFCVISSNCRGLCLLQIKILHRTQTYSSHLIPTGAAPVQHKGDPPARLASVDSPWGSVADGRGLPQAVLASVVLGRRHVHTHMVSLPPSLMSTLPPSLGRSGLHGAEHTHLH